MAPIMLCNGNRHGKNCGEHCILIRDGKTLNCHFCDASISLNTKAQQANCAPRKVATVSPPRAFDAATLVAPAM